MSIHAALQQSTEAGQYISEEELVFNIKSFHSSLLTHQ